ncbi:unnamed protein product, partial [Rotaria sp. Silwood1]
MYKTFLETIPSILCNIYSNNSTEELEPWFCKVENHLKNVDQSIHKHIQNILHSSRCLTTNSLLFVWDQYLITRDISEFHNEL